MIARRIRLVRCKREAQVGHKEEIEGERADPEEACGEKSRSAWRNSEKESATQDDISGPLFAPGGISHTRRQGCVPGLRTGCANASFRVVPAEGADGDQALCALAGRV